MGVKQCCCGCTLKTGTIVIGALTALGAASTIVHSIVYLVIPPLLNRMKEGNWMQDDAIITGLFYLGNAIVIIMGLQLTVSLMLIYGANNETSDLVNPWIVYSSLSLGLMAIPYFAFMMYLVVVVHDGTVAIMFFSGVLYVALQVYFIVVVKRFNRELEEGRRELEEGPGVPKSA